MPRLIELAAHVAKACWCRLAACHVVLAPKGESLEPEANPEGVAQAEELLRQAAAEGTAQGIDVDSFFEVAHSVPEGLISAATVDGAEILVVGYSDEIPGPDSKEREFSRTMYRVARGHKQLTAVAKFRRDTLNSISIPLSFGADMLAVGVIAQAVATATGADIRLLHVVEPGANPEDEKVRCSALADRYGLLDIGELELVRSARPGATLIEKTNESDLCIVAACGRNSLSDAIFGSAAERIAERSTATVLLVRSAACRVD